MISPCFTIGGQRADNSLMNTYFVASFLALLDLSIKRSSCSSFYGIPSPFFFVPHAQSNGFAVFYQILSVGSLGEYTDLVHRIHRFHNATPTTVMILFQPNFF